jgi:ubiquinone/menaquinone biosynthesis C-methylase UbiE
VLDRLRRKPFYVAYKARTIQLLNLSPGGLYLDLGGGTGDDAQALVGQVADTSAVVVDLSAAMVIEAARRGNVALVGAAEALPFRHDTFDGCRADRTFQHLADPDRALQELLRVTRPGGRIVIVDPSYDTQAVDVDDQELARKVLRFRADRMVRNDTLAHRMPGLLTRAGMVEVQVEP